MELTRQHQTIDHSPFVTTNRERVDRLDFNQRMEFRKSIAIHKGQEVIRIPVPVEGIYLKSPDIKALSHFIALGQA